MTADKRSSIRRPIALDVLIHYDFLDPRLWRTRDLGLDCAFVRMRKTELPPGAAVEAVLMLEYLNEFAEHPVAAQIVRVAKDGVALKFHGYEERTREALARLIYADGPRAARDRYAPLRH